MAEEAAQKASIKILFPLVIFVLPAMIAVIIGPAMISVMHTLLRADRNLKSPLPGGLGPDAPTRRSGAFLFGASARAQFAALCRR